MKHGRIHWFVPEELNDEQRWLYDGLVNGPRNSGPNPTQFRDERGRLNGAFNSRLLSPRIGYAIQNSGAAVRYRSQLSARMREMAILEVAHSERCNYEWNDHAETAAKAGLSEREIEAIRTGTDAPSLSPEEAVACKVVQSLIHERDLPDALFAEAEETLGPVTVFDLISVVGHYQHTAMSIRVWRVPLREGTSPVFGPEI